MQDRTYNDLLFLIQSLVGGGNLTTEEQGSIDSFINRRAHEAFQTSQTWPRFLVSSEERALSSYNLSRATDSTNPSVNQNYKFLGLAAASSITLLGDLPFPQIQYGLCDRERYGVSGRRSIAERHERTEGCKAVEQHFVRLH